MWAGILALGLAAGAPRPGPPRPPPPPAAPAPAPAPGQNPELAKAEKLLDDLDYDAAALALLQASKTPRNDRKTLLRILELQGVIAASLDQKAPAVSFFKQLLALDPGFKLSESAYSAEQRAPFNQAKTWLAGTQPLRFEVAPARAKPGLVESVVVKAGSDPLSMGRKVRFWLRIGEAPWKEVVVPLADGRAQAAAGVESVSFWAELLGDYDAQLAVIGSRDKPVVLRAPAATGPLLAGGPLLELNGYRPYALAAGGAGVVAAAIGVLFGARSAAAAPQIAQWREEQRLQGSVTSVTQVEATRVINEANANAVTADVLYGAAVVLAGGGAALWFVEPEKAPPSRPAPGGGLQLDVRWRF
ncbi:MAG TPA: hypothetical protein VND93_14895 [Myxococcales bacterium]|nr:hypothetical protein [Myxococcales bacterium]